MVEKSRAIETYVCPCSLQSQCCLCNSSFSIILPSWCLSNSAVRKDLSCRASMSSISACQVGAASFKHADGAHLSINVSGKEETRLGSHTQRQHLLGLCSWSPRSELQLWTSIAWASWLLIYRPALLGASWMSSETNMLWRGLALSRAATNQSSPFALGSSSQSLAMLFSPVDAKHLSQSGREKGGRNEWWNP